MKIKAKKCQISEGSCGIEGRIVAADGCRLDPNNIRAVTNLARPKPKTFGDVRRLLGMIEYFRKYIPNFRKTAEPLHVLLKKIDGQSNSSKHHKILHFFGYISLL